MGAAYPVSEDDAGDAAGHARAAARVAPGDGHRTGPSFATVQAFDAALAAAAPRVLIDDVTPAGRDARSDVQAPHGVVAYRASTPSGVWLLEIDVAQASVGAVQPPGTAVQAAMTLARAEPLLRALDGWCVDNDHGLPDWTWLDTGPHGETGAAVGVTTPRWADDVPPAASMLAVVRPTAGDATQPGGDRPARAQGDVARARWQLPGGVSGSIAVPWNALRASARMHLHPAELQWQRVHAVCVLDRFDLEAHDIECLEPGGAVVLPATMSPGWVARLRAHGEAEGAGLALRLAVGPGDVAVRGVISAAGAVHTSRARTWEVRSLRPLSVEADQLCGWAALEGLPQALFTELELARTRADGPPIGVMPGTLMPWGRGAALWLRSA